MTAPPSVRQGLNKLFKHSEDNTGLISAWEDMEAGPVIKFYPASRFSLVNVSVCMWKGCICGHGVTAGEFKSIDLGNLEVGG